MVLFKRIEVDLEKERARIKNNPYNKRQRAVLNKLVDLFEAGEFQKCLNLVNDKKSFPRYEYDEKEHIGYEISKILHDVAHFNYYTREDLLEQAKKKLKKNGRNHS